LRRVIDEVLKPEFLLGIACALMFIGSFAPWVTFDGLSTNALGRWQGMVAFIGGLLLLFGTLVNYEFFGIQQIDTRRPLTNAGIGALGGLLGIVGGVSYGLGLGVHGSPGWGLYLTILAGLFGLYVSYRLYQLEQPAIPKVV
jgi:hypothetical protein